MSVEMPGTRPWVKAIRSDFAPELPAGVGIPLGGTLHKMAIDPRIKPGSRAYRATLRLTAGVGIIQHIEEQVGPLAITTPTAGAIVPPVHDIAGSGGYPGAPVELWHVEGNQMVATATPDAEGNWIFGGDTPASLGVVTWEVRQGPRTPASVTITVEEPV
jgi:hypothetical protein